MDFLIFNTSEASKKQEVSKIGYGLDDSKLGGPLSQTLQLYSQHKQKTNNIGESKRKIFIQVKAGKFLKIKKDFF